MSTIVSISTAPGIGGIGIIRMSGEKSFEILDKIFKPKTSQKIEDIKGYTIKYGHIVENNEIIDEVLVSYFKAPRSYTTENMCEINSHGGNVVVKKILEKHIYKHNEELKIIVNEAQRILDTVIAEPEVVNNITEIRNVSTDMYTHCINVCTLSTIMALRLKMSNKQIHNIAMGAILHDIGLRYINVPYVNVSENKMTNKDAVEYKKHTIFGYSSLQDEEWLPDVAKEIILFHHERIDGSGYPFQHKGDRLKPEVKLVSICDDFDSMISGIGSEKMKIYEAIEYIKVHSGVKYDPTIASKFLDSVAAYPVGCTVYTSDGEKAVVIRQNKEAADRPVIRMTEHADGTPYTENVEYNLLKQLTMFIVDTE